MRHRKGFNHLSRKSSHRKAMLANMASSLILHKRIKTTTAKAKALRMYVEPLITKSKDDSTHSRRTVFSYLQNKDAVSELFREVSPKIMERPGGYTRILKTGNRMGDNAEMCIVELVDYNENLLSAKDESAAKSGRRRRRGGKKKPGEAQAQPEASALETAEDVKTDEPDDIATEETTATESTDTAGSDEKTEEETARVSEAEASVAEEDTTEEEKKAEETGSAPEAETVTDESADNKGEDETKEDTTDKADSSESEEKKE
jgi:large subunit ribosomal protein L17